MFSLEMIPIYLGLIGLITAYFLYKFILGFSAGSGKIVEISEVRSQHRAIERTFLI